MIYGEELKEIQLIELDILKSVTDLCNENNINYFIIGGTLLGAVRHKGFIPWDDDIDIGMSREDYNKFIAVAKEKLADDLFLQTFQTEPESPFYFAKVRKNGTKFVEYYCKKLKINHGVFFDIFPFDNIPDDDVLRKKQLREVKFWSNLFIAKNVTGSSVPQNTFLGKLKIILRTISHVALIPIPKQFLFEKLDSAAQKYNSTECKMKSYVEYPRTMIRSADIENLEVIEFEGLSVCCHGNAEDSLERQYGDFMTLPPENQRVGHRPYILEL